ncbi:MAG: pilus assembly protein PilO [Candidatus Dadabacteria bacterium]|nr:MAG: pilus assembly protein PilO [Candidatus Dadabacteria bacterium]
MNPLVENFLERPRSHQIGFWVGSLLLASFIFWQYFYSSKLEEYRKLSDKIEELNNNIAHEKRLARSLPRVKEEVKELNLKLKMALAELPDKREIPDLLTSISNLARDAGLEIIYFKPKGENLKDFYAEVPVSMSVRGTYHQVATFFDEVGNLPRIVNIKLVEMKNPRKSDDRIRITTDCVATTFRYLDESERVVKKKKGRRRRRR